jgi:hypothetical protein
MQKPCKVRENENACRTRASRAGPKRRRRQGVKKDDTVEKRATVGRRSRKKKIRNPKHEIRNKPEAQKTKIPNEAWPEHRGGFVLVIWILVLNLFRISNFEIRIWMRKNSAYH